MNVWKLVSAGKLEKSDEPVPAAEEGKLKVRVTKVLLSGSDADVLNGSENLKLKYPFIPCSYAIGLIAEESGNALFPKGTRVVLHAFHPAPDMGSEKKDFSESDYLVSGQTCDGFLRDILYLSPDEITPLPDSVNDFEALLLHYVAFAKAAVDTIYNQKGEHICVVGANILGILISQLLIYQQAAPVLLDSDEARLDVARAAGVYYTQLCDDSLLDNVGTVTGGRLADGAVYVTSAKGNELNTALMTCARDKRVVVCGISADNLTFDLGLALRKNLSIDCVSDCVDYLETAINLFANKAVNIECFTPNATKESGIAATLERFAKQEKQNVAECDYLVLL